MTRAQARIAKGERISPVKYSGFSDDDTDSYSPSVQRNEVVVWHSDGMFEPVSIPESNTEVEGFNSTITDPRAFYSFGLYAIKDHRDLDEYLL